jgi:hypothetical protein
MDSDGIVLEVKGGFLVGCVCGMCVYVRERDGGDQSLGSKCVDN